MHVQGCTGRSVVPLLTCTLARGDPRCWGPRAGVLDAVCSVCRGAQRHRCSWCAQPAMHRDGVQGCTVTVSASHGPFCISGQPACTLPACMHRASCLVFSVQNRTPPKLLLGGGGLHRLICSCRGSSRSATLRCARTWLVPSCQTPLGWRLKTSWVMLLRR